MAFFKTLKDLQNKTAKPDYGDGERIPRFFSVKPGEEYKIRFRQELTADLSGYNEEAGLAAHVMVHTNPGDFTKQATCTGDNEEFGYTCWACQQIPKDKGWRAKGHLIVNVAVWNDDDGKWEPRVLDQKFTPAHCAEDLVGYASEYGTIMDRDYKIKRKGQKQDTQYTLIPVTINDADGSIAELPYHDVLKTYRTFSPAEQAGFYLSAEDKGKSNEWE